MPVIRINTGGDNAWSDLRQMVEANDPRLIQAMGGETVWALTILEGGMVSGRYSVGLRLTYPTVVMWWPRPVGMLLEQPFLL